MSPARPTSRLQCIELVELSVHRHISRSVTPSCAVCCYKAVLTRKTTLLFINVYYSIHCTTHLGYQAGLGFGFGINAPGLGLDIVTAAHTIVWTDVMFLSCDFIYLFICLFSLFQPAYSLPTINRFGWNFTFGSLTGSWCNLWSPVPNGANPKQNLG